MPESCDGEQKPNPSKMYSANEAVRKETLKNISKIELVHIQHNNRIRSKNAINTSATNGMER